MARRSAAVLLPLALLVGCAAPPARTTALNDDAITIASFNFPESVLLAELYGQALRSAGFRVEFALDLGARELVEPALIRGLVEFVPEYAGSALDFLAGDGSASPNEARTHLALTAALSARDVTVLSASPAQDRNGIVVTPSTASRYGLHDISDLSTHAPRLTFGGPPECRHRQLCLPGLESVYGLTFKSFLPLDEGGPLTVAALEQGQVQLGVLFTSDGQIDAHGLVLLRDDRHLQPAENVTPIVREEVLARFGPKVARVADAISAALTTDELRAMNASILLQGRSPSAVAAAWLSSHGLDGSG
jgi:osmoprotectant transport system substrate-binding protein